MSAKMTLRPFLKHVSLASWLIGSFSRGVWTKLFFPLPLYMMNPMRRRIGYPDHRKNGLKRLKY